MIPTYALAPRLSQQPAQSSRHIQRGTLVSQDIHLTSAKQIIDFIETRYIQNNNNNNNNNNEGDWTKTRNYLYHTHASLSTLQITNVLNFLEDSFDDHTIRQILQNSPRILRKNPISKLQPTADFLRSLYGSDMFQQAILRNPSLLLTSGIGYERESQDLETYLHQEWSLSKSSITALKLTAPFVLSLRLDQVKAVCTYLSTLLQRGGIDPTTVMKKIITAHPHLLNLNVEQNLQPRIHFLIQNCQLSDKDVATLLQKSSSILGLSVSNNLQPTLDYLRPWLQHDNDLLKKTVMAHAPILGLSLDNLQQKVEYFNAMEKSFASRILIRCPAVYSLSLLDNIIPKVHFLRRVWGLKSHETMPLLREYPGILTLSLEGNIQPTIRFYNTTGYTHVTSDWMLQPGAKGIRGRYIAASLFQRLLPRWHFLQQHGVSTLPVHVLVGATDKAFCQHFLLDLSQYQRFQQESVSRLKFSSQFDTWLKTGRPIDADTNVQSG